MTFLDKNGKKILQENDESRSFKPITVEGTGGYTVTQSFLSLDDNEGIYGLGQHQSNEFNYKGKNEELFQYNTKVSIPFVVSTATTASCGTAIRCAAGEIPMTTDSSATYSRSTTTKAAKAH